MYSLFALTTQPNVTTAETAEATAVMWFILIAMFLFVAVTYVVVAIFLSRIFKKAGVLGWKAWVPVYNTWVTLEIGDQKGWWALVMLFPVVNIIASVFLYIAMYTIGLRLGKEGTFVLWAIFLPIVWYAWLALDDSTWDADVTGPTQSDTSATA